MQLPGPGAESGGGEDEPLCGGPYSAVGGQNVGKLFRFRKGYGSVSYYPRVL